VTGGAAARAEAIANAESSTNMPSPSTIRTIDMRLIDDLFDMNSGYVLDFSDRTFAAFFAEELGLNIDDPRYSAEGTSKAKRLRCFLKTVDQATRIRLLTALWDYRQAVRRRTRAEEKLPNAEDEFWGLIERLGGKRRSPRDRRPAPNAPDGIEVSRSHSLRDRLLQLSDLEATKRGFAFERFLKELFDANGLAARASFRLVGEQIDGSFELAAETYLLEAKWTGPRIGASDLHAFNGKVEEKAAWARGLFVSNSGFSDEGLIAFGRGKRLVCMDGLDLHEMLDRGLSLAAVIRAKVRRAAESGQAFVRVRELFP
jgi:hypothetical protein